MQYGLYDTGAHQWLGSNDDNTGPKLYPEDQEFQAQVAARMVDVQLVQPAGRTKAMPFPENEEFVKVSEEDVTHTPEEALKLLEEGLVL